MLDTTYTQERVFPLQGSLFQKTGKNIFTIPILQKVVGERQTMQLSIAQEASDKAGDRA